MRLKKRNGHDHYYREWAGPVRMPDGSFDWDRYVLRPIYGRGSWGRIGDHEIALSRKGHGHDTSPKMRRGLKRALAKRTRACEQREIAAQMDDGCATEVEVAHALYLFMLDLESAENMEKLFAAHAEIEICVWEKIPYRRGRRKAFRATRLISPAKAYHMADEG